jgi:hypothetical protein
MKQEQEFFFFIADISGFTSYMLQNKKAAIHAQISINEIIKALIKVSQLPIEVSKLEGDAIFLYMYPIGDSLWLSQKLFQFFATFDEKIKELKESNICRCGACKNIDSLNLKIIVHYGLAFLEKVYQFKELSGIDVIVVHRLLKNHVAKKRYVLLTEAAYQHMHLPADLVFSKGIEVYDDIQEISIYVCDPPVVPKELQGNYHSIFYKLKCSFIMSTNDFLSRIGLGQIKKFRNLPPPPS